MELRGAYAILLFLGLQLQSGQLSSSCEGQPNAGFPLLLSTSSDDPDRYNGYPDVFAELPRPDLAGELGLLLLFDPEPHDDNCLVRLVHDVQHGLIQLVHHVQHGLDHAHVYELSEQCISHHSDFDGDQVRVHLVTTSTVTKPASTCSATTTETSTATKPGSTCNGTVTTSTVTKPGSTCSATTVNATATTVTITASASTNTIITTIPPATNTITTTASASTTTITVTAGGNGAPVDQNGCPAIEGYSDGEGFVYHCGVDFGPGSLSQGTNPGFNVEDCTQQCFYNFLGGDCLGASFTPANPPYDNFGQLRKGTCTLYYFPDGMVPAPGVAVALIPGT